MKNNSRDDEYVAHLRQASHISVVIQDDFDLHRIAQSGQCFRWQRIAADTYRILHTDQSVYVSDHRNGEFCFECDETAFRAVWERYFDLAESYQGIRARISPSADPFLWTAAEHEKGIRILRQDPWEILITFIISQNRNIPAIRRSVDMLSESCGEMRTDSRGFRYHAFPCPDALASLNENQLKECRLGYRWKYVQAAADAVSSGKIDIYSLQGAGYDDILRELTGLFGVGRKVANCVALFGLHLLNAFPRDIWINRVLEREYPNGYPFDQYSPYNGVYQQYMFACYRNRN